MNNLNFYDGPECVLPGGSIGVKFGKKELLFLNKGFSSLSGYTFEELQAFGDSWFAALIHPADEKNIEAIFLSLKTNARIECEARIICKSGHTVWTNIYAGFVKNELGEYLQIIFIDNTKAHYAQISATSTKKDLDAVIANIPGGVARVMVNEDFKILFASDGFYKLTGYTREEYNSVPILGKGRALILKQDLPEVFLRIKHQIENNEPLFVEYRILKKDNTIAWIEAHGSPVDTQNSVPVAQVVFADTTATKKNTRRLLELTNSIPGGVAHIKYCENTLAVEYASDGFFRLIGCTREEACSLGITSNCSPLFSSKDWKDLLNKVKSFLEQGAEVGEYECKISCVNGETKWIHLRAGSSSEDFENTIECVLIDVTQVRKNQELLRKSEQRYRIISEQMSEVIIDWDIKTGDVFHSVSYEKRFGYKLDEKNAIHFLMHSDIIFESDKQYISALIDKISAGEPYGEAEYRTKKINGKYEWCGIKLTTLFDDENKPERAIGIIMNIDGFKRHAFELEALAKNDSLTGSLNKCATMESIAQSLSEKKPEHMCALFILDIDEFKIINDTYGHPTGDAVLVEIVKRLRAQTRQGDIIGRMGGDEFVVYIASDMLYKDALKKAKSFIKAIAPPVTFKNIKCSARVSIGIALSASSGDNLDTLYEHADKALYRAKAAGKSQAIIYE